MFLVKDHLLVEEATGTPVRFERTENRTNTTLSPLYLVMHYTAGTSMNGAIGWMRNPAAKASAHVVIGRDGTVVQMVEANRIAWHAGTSKWGELDGLNRYAIGIELDNAGKLQRRADGAYVAAFSGQVIPPEDVVLARHKHEASDAGWHAYTPKQLAVAVAVGQALNAHYRFKDVLGHDDIAPDRKIDPGPAFPMGSYRSQVLGRG